MTALRNARVLADGHGEETTLPSMEAHYRHLRRCDPDRDIVVVELDGGIVGYARTTWDDTGDGTRDHWLVVEADAHHPGLDARVLDWCRTRAEENAHRMALETGRPQQLITEASLGGPRESLLAAHGFAPVRYAAMMARPHLRDIPDRPLPDGIEIRPVADEHLRSIFHADKEAFRGQWGYVEPTEDDWGMFCDDARSSGTGLWQVAWAGDEVVGQVRTYVNPGERELFGVHRAWTEQISTARAFRSRGIASAVICASLRQLAELGFEQATLGVDTENPTGAFRLYESLGYEVVAMDAVFTRPVPGAPALD